MGAFRPYIRHRHFRHHTGGVSYTPTQIAKLLGVPAGAGSGRKIAVIELGGAYNQKDLDAYFAGLGLKVKPVVFHSIQGAQNISDGPDGADGEVMLDLCVAGGVAPGAELHCYTAPNTDAGFLAAINAAIHDKMDAISISWGAPEDQWSTPSLKSFDAAFADASAKGISVTVAAGDNGSSDGEARGAHVDFPASSPNVIACGGTSLPSTSPRNEVVWNDGTQGGATGGGVSGVFALPAYQAKAGLPSTTHRCVPDLAGLADPETGWNIVVDGQSMIIGGTSAVAPLMAALAVALTGQAVAPGASGLGTRFMLAALYATAGVAYDVTSGNNGMYTARSGPDCCTGVGVPFYAKLLAALKPPAPAPGPSPSPTPTPSPVHSTTTFTVEGDNVKILVNGKTVASI